MGGGLAAAVAQGHVRVGEAAGLPLHRHSLAATAAAHTAGENAVVGKVLINTSEG